MAKLALALPVVGAGFHGGNLNAVVSNVVDAVIFEGAVAVGPEHILTAHPFVSFFGDASGKEGCWKTCDFSDK